MRDSVRRVGVTAAALVLAGSVLVLGQQNRLLRQANRDLLKNLSRPHRGMLVPVFFVRTLAGDTVTIGESREDGRQVLFFFTTTCEYCRASIPVLLRLDAALRRDPTLRGKLYVVAFDSATVIRRFVDSVGLAVPVVVPPSGRFATLYRVRAVPQLMVLDSSGRTTYARAGELNGPGVLDSILAGVAWRPRPSVTTAAATKQ
jgi:thiol-disulfide isomerase/thioredoxin